MPSIEIVLYPEASKGHKIDYMKKSLSPTVVGHTVDSQYMHNTFSNIARCCIQHGMG